MARSKRKGRCGRYCMVCHGPKVVYGEGPERAALRLSLTKLDVFDLRNEGTFFAGETGPKHALTRKKA